MLVTTDGTREFHLKPGENTIGREDADILLAHNTVSRRHAKITVDCGQARVEDLGSTNGSFVDGAKVAGGLVDLKDGCEVMFGSITLKYVAPEVVESEARDGEVREGGAPAGFFSSVQAQQGCLPGGFLTPPYEEGRGGYRRRSRTDRTTRLHPSASWYLNGAYSYDRQRGQRHRPPRWQRDSRSRSILLGRHAELLAEDGKFTITDLGSTNGTMVNGVRLDGHCPRARARR